MSLPESDPFLKRKMTALSVLPRIVLFLTVVAVVVGMNYGQLDFAWWYHNDEPSKVQQIQSGERNLRHPPLMLSVTDLLAKISGAGEDAQAVVKLGRMLSTVSMALALALMVDWAFVMVGPGAALLLAVVFPFQPELFEVGHYFKEDALFILGIALSLRSLAFWVQKPGNPAAVCLGVSLAVLAGGKYVGWFLIALILLQALLVGRNFRSAVGTLLMVFLAVVLVIYWPAFVRMNIFKLFLADEISLLFAGDYGTGLAVPHGTYWRKLSGAYSQALVLVGATCYIVAVIRKRATGFWIMPVSCMVTMLCLAWTSKYSDRYLLPVLLMGMVILVCGPVMLVRSFVENRVSGTWKSALPFLAGGAAAAVLFILQYGNFQSVSSGFKTDSRQELIGWIKTHLDAGKVILAEDELAKISDPLLYDRMWRAYFVADLGSPSELKAQGVTHVVVSYDVYHRFVDANVVRGGAGAGLFLKRRHFYREILGEGKILWSRKAIDPKALHPGLTLVELR